jgi:hypothetical protein
MRPILSSGGPVPGIAEGRVTPDRRLAGHPRALPLGHIPARRILAAEGGSAKSVESVLGDIITRPA